MTTMQPITPEPRASLLAACGVCGAEDRPQELVVVLDDGEERWMHPACAVEDTRRLLAG